MSDVNGEQDPPIYAELVRERKEQRELPGLERLVLVGNEAEGLVGVGPSR